MARKFNEDVGVRQFVITAMEDEDIAYRAKGRATQPEFVKFLYESTDLTKKEIAYIFGMKVRNIEAISKKEQWRKNVKVIKYSIPRLHDAIIGGTFGVIPVNYESEEELRKRSSHVLRVLSLILEHDVKTDNLNPARAGVVGSYASSYKSLYTAQLEAYGYIKTADKIEFDIKYKQLELKMKELEKENKKLVIENIKKFESALGLTGGEIVRMFDSVAQNFLENETKNLLIEAFTKKYKEVLKVKDVDEALPAIEIDEETGGLSKRSRRGK